jgi:hypothetical protein
MKKVFGWVWKRSIAVLSGLMVLFSLLAIVMDIAFHESLRMLLADIVWTILWAILFVYDLVSTKRQNDETENEVSLSINIELGKGGSKDVD